jgi:hypothetical protein
MWRWMLVLLAVVSLAGTASAITITPQGAQVQVDYDEPTTNADGTPLDDLKETRVYVKLPNQAPSVATTVPASRPTGGGHVTTTITIPVAQGTVVAADVWATAVDTSGNESGPSNVVTVRIDLLPPAPPR